jgi:hypothetical protein
MVLATIAGLGIVVLNHVHKPNCQIAMFAGGVPGTHEATTALDFARSAKIDTVINYSSINADPRVVKAYLDDALARGVKVMLSIKDLLGDTDLDSDAANVMLHQQYGATTDEQVADIIKRFDSHPAVDGYFISDELPQEAEGDEGADKWMPLLQHRYEQVKSLTNKRVLTSMYRNPLPFLKQVSANTGDLMMDYYPFPDAQQVPSNQHYGTVAEIKPIAADMRAAAGDGSWMAVQAFSWQREPAMVEQFGFPADAPAPNAKEMIQMASLAREGGVSNLAFFSYEYATATPDQLDEVRRAALAIRELSGCS